MVDELEDKNARRKPPKSLLKDPTVRSDEPIGKCIEDDLFHEIYLTELQVRNSATDSIDEISLQIAKKDFRVTTKSEACRRKNAIPEY